MLSSQLLSVSSLLKVFAVCYHLGLILSWYKSTEIRIPCHFPSCHEYFHHTKVSQIRCTSSEALTHCNRSNMFITSHLNMFQTASFSPENSFPLCLEGKFKYIKIFAFSKDAFRTGILIIQTNDNVFLHQPVHLFMPLFLLMHFSF